MPVCAEPFQLVAQLVERRIIAGGQTGQCHLLIAGVVAAIQAVLRAQVTAPVSHRTIHIPRLAEPAAADTSPEQLQHHPILHDLRRRHDGFCREIGRVHIVHDALGHHGGCPIVGNDLLDRTVGVVTDLVQTGHVDTVQLCRRHQEAVLVPSLTAGFSMQLDEFRGNILALAQRHDVDKIRQRLRVIHGGAAGDHQRGQFRALCAVQRDPCQIQHIQDPGKRHLIAHGKRHDVKVGDRVAGLQREKRHIRPAHLLLHVAPRGKYPFAPHAVHGVHHAVQDPHTQIGHTDLIGVGEAERDAGIHVLPVLDDSVVFPAHIACRLLHTGQNAFQSLVHGHSPLLLSF